MRETLLLPRAVEWCHRLLKDTIRAGSAVLDATAGNGHDTLFLAKQTGPHGHVFAFDIQQEALNSTAQLLSENNIPPEAYTLIQASHADVKKHLPQPFQGRMNAVMFNLGFLPGGDKSLITKTTSTLSALSATSGLLEPGGILSVITYPGHSFGNEEALAVENWMSSLLSDRFEVQAIKAVNRIQPAPELWLARAR